jgi:hypothetical protein
VPGPSAAGALPAGSAAGRFAGWVAGCPVDGRRGGVSVAPSTTIPGRVVCAAAVAGITSAPATASQGHAPRGAPDLCLHSSERIAMRPLLRRVIRRSLQRGEPSPHAHLEIRSSRPAPAGGHRSRILHASFNCDCLPTTTQSPLRRSALPRAPHGRWATRAGRSPGSRLERLLRPSRGRDVRRQWHVWRRLAAYSCGGSRGIRANGPSPRSLFTHPLAHG